MARSPIPSLKHLTLKQVRLARLFLLLGLFSVLVLYAVFRSQRFQEAMRRKSERLLSAQIGRKVSIGGFDLALFPFSFVVKEVAIENDRRSLAGPLFSASEIEIRGLPSITSDRIELSKLRVIAPRVVVEVFPDGSTNVDPVLKALRGEEAGGRTSSSTRPSSSAPPSASASGRTRSTHCTSCGQARRPGCRGTSQALGTHAPRGVSASRGNICPN